MKVQKVNIITSLCGAGLEREAILLRSLLSTYGISSNFIHYTGGPNERMESADLNICLEVVCGQTFYLAPETWLAPNSEWWPSINDQFLPKISKYLCKTRDCQRIWSAKVSAEKCVYTSFEARDLYQPQVPRTMTCLHVAGKAGNKGTETVIDTWQQFEYLPPLTVVANNPEFGAQVAKAPKNITYHARVSDEELTKLMNRNYIHILPSKYEGFGHVIWEAMGCSGMVITTDASPMNEYPGIAALVPTASSTPQRLAQLHSVNPQDICNKVIETVQLSPTEQIEKSHAARASYLANCIFFRETIMRLIHERG